ncbi:hypothetical protein ENBRE01_1008 [Enteropsectra breve]|nr:hypothetical protein ENBRE01_1008 [Enteropsectra breve]
MLLAVKNKYVLDKLPPADVKKWCMVFRIEMFIDVLLDKAASTAFELLFITRYMEIIWKHLDHITSQFDLLTNRLKVMGSFIALLRKLDYHGIKERLVASIRKSSNPHLFANLLYAHLEFRDEKICLLEDLIKYKMQSCRKRSLLNKAKLLQQVTLQRVKIEEALISGGLLQFTAQKPSNHTAYLLLTLFRENKLVSPLSHIISEGASFISELKYQHSLIYKRILEETLIIPESLIAS